MLISRLEGNLHSYDISKFKIDTIDIQWYDTRKKIARWKSRNGKDVAMKLTDAPKMGLSQGDILYQKGDEILAINILPAQVLCIYAQSSQEVAKICYEIGNRHSALFFGEDAFEFRTPFEKPLKALFDKLNIKNSVLSARLDSASRISVSMAHAEPNVAIKESPDFKITLYKQKEE
ncbi:urease accessory protein UreE [Helicobacter sp. 11S03491-1]|uniref:urease accessory protein UreE n=1 Tax=Helicobacter sp. 11S03491-1 TaxID=1476196 RepID=UPI000BA566E4|nr:urease accessory protein UreE [Helicobacter sp. 11S03491-1]PAF43865.1 urease accessory protein UreE [Helicobacter sp. 11S03491-1]